MGYLHERGVKGYVALNILVSHNRVKKVPHKVTYQVTHSVRNDSEKIDHL
jgi:collagenase-like PrtC family protease